ncbi:hypothetical protein P409_00320 [Inquilinus limosus MP06]|uniref:Uncharacterized protein n=1 Tax=Inquilinus limosus MP06 TaxID=1398085 RepID=A0A0A0DDK4_9PROT|nr:hypothetical protein P409_00320 [Inquilinus limosus MP06]
MPRPDYIILVPDEIFTPHLKRIIRLVGDILHLDDLVAVEDETDPLRAVRTMQLQQHHETSSA